MRTLTLLATSALLTAGTGLLAATPAAANVVVCNQSQQNANVARAWLNNDWQAEGWFYVRPGECKNIITNPARFSTAHLYIMNDQGSPWILEPAGQTLPTRQICARREKFAHTNAAGNCVQNMLRLPFQKIPIRNTFTVHLT